jgi:hypothetical protein
MSVRSSFHLTAAGHHDDHQNPSYGKGPATTADRSSSSSDTSSSSSTVGSPRPDASSDASPRFYVTRAASSAEALAHQRRLKDVTDMFGVCATTQLYADYKKPRIAAGKIVCSAGAIVNLFGMPRDSLFVEIAGRCPRGSDRELIEATGEFVQANVDILIRELLDVKQRIDAEHSEAVRQQDRSNRPPTPVPPCGNEYDSVFFELEHASCSSPAPDPVELANQWPDDVIYDTQMQMMSDLLESLRQLSQFMLQGQRRTDSSRARLRALKRMQCQQFYENFCFEQYGSVVEPPSADAMAEDEPHECTLCEPVPGDELHVILLACCQHNSAVCHRCLSKHAYTQSERGIKSFFQCPFCRAELSLYGHLDQ